MGRLSTANKLICVLFAVLLVFAMIIEVVRSNGPMLDALTACYPALGIAVCLVAALYWGAPCIGTAALIIVVTAFVKLLVAVLTAHAIHLYMLANFGKELLGTLILIGIYYESVERE